MKVFEKQFVSFDKVRANTLMKKFLGMKHKNSTNVPEHIMEISNVDAQLESLETDIF